MNINSSFKIQNVRSLNLSSNIEIRRGKNNALTHETDDVIFIINAQVGQHKQIVEKEFITCKNGPYMTYFNSNSSRAVGVGIAIKLTSDIQVLDSERDTDDRILILKTMIDNELITLVSFYDNNENKDCYLHSIENLENAELTKIYEDRNIIVVPLLQRIADIERERKENNDPGLDEEEEHYIITQIEAEDTKLPTLKHIH